MALLPAGYLKAVVSLGVVIDESFAHVGTSFLYSHYVDEIRGQNTYTHFLITNKHVIDADVTHVRFDHPATESLEVCSIDNVSQAPWSPHPGDIDVAVRPLVVDCDLVKDRTIGGDSFTDHGGIPSSDQVRQISEGDGVFVLGFPLGLLGEERNYPIVRQGAVARIQDWLHGHSETFLIDAPAFPGSSGGPVVLRPQSAAIKETQQITRPLLLGVNTGFIPSRDEAVSKQTGSTRVIFEENSGLAHVVPISSLKEILDSYTYNPPDI